jgi:hydrogenase maturation protease
MRSGLIPHLLVGGVGYWWQRDASFGLVACDHFAAMHWPDGVEIRQLDYGALYVMQDLADADPPYDRLVLVAGVSRGRAPGQVYRRHWDGALPGAIEIQERIREAGAGVVHVDHLLVIGQHFGALPQDVVVIEIEPVDANGGEGLSAPVLQLLPRVTELVREEVGVTA